MKKITPALVAFALFIFTPSIFSQSSEGYVRLKMFYSRTPLVKADERKTFSTKDTVLALPAGTHIIKVWAPTTQLIDSTIVCKAGDTVSYIFKQRTTPEYKKYITDINYYRQVRNQRQFASPILMGIAVGSGIYCHKLADQAVERALRNKEEYISASSQASMDKFEKEFNDNKKDYLKFSRIEKSLYVTAGLLA